MADAPHYGRCAAGLFVAFALWMSPGAEGPPSAPPRAEVPDVLPREAPPPAFRALLRGQRLDVNTAPAGALEQLPGIGPALAARIVEARARAPFRRAEELVRVRGLGERSVARLRPWLRWPAARRGEKPRPSANLRKQPGGSRR